MQRPETGRFLESLPCGRTELDRLWIVLSSVATVPSGQQRAMLRSILDALDSAKLIRLPKTKNCWDASALPHLPMWISRPALKAERQYAGAVIWAPELSFLASRKEPADSPWLGVDAWLKENRNVVLDRVPIRERSLEIFGDEKVLDGLMNSQPFKSGVITLDALSCYYVPEPPAWKRGPRGSESLPGLCVENSTTYDVLHKFNREAGLWGFVAYGRGNGFATVVEGILPIMEEFGHARIRYFGDADHEGLEIAARGAAKFTAAGKELELEARLYHLILQAGARSHSKSGGLLSPAAAELVEKAALFELPAIFLEKKRIAQEWAGLRKLREAFLAS